mmetsp:Transcript_28990/g.84969  ORF Transcript_28990/g.84969 Transcript_28990/m.84969 type:complete len:218 (+) Transcript_28990:824-1477(+)
MTPSLKKVTGIGACESACPAGPPAWRGLDPAAPNAWWAWRLGIPMASLLRAASSLSPLSIVTTAGMSWGPRNMLVRLSAGLAAAGGPEGASCSESVVGREDGEGMGPVWGVQAFAARISLDVAVGARRPKRARLLGACAARALSLSPARPRRSVHRDSRTARAISGSIDCACAAVLMASSDAAAARAAASRCARRISAHLEPALSVVAPLIPAAAPV